MLNCSAEEMSRDLGAQEQGFQACFERRQQGSSPAGGRLESGWAGLAREGFWT